MKDKARQRLAQLKRGEVLPVPNRTSVHCPNCGKWMPWNLKKCSKCKHRLPPRPPLRCRLCLDPCPKRRRSWCSDECMEAYFMVSDTQFLRGKVHDRDRGVCRRCGIDCSKLRRRINKIERGPALQQALQVLKDQGFSVGKPEWVGYCPSLWQADHIEALDEGGSFELSNVQTLCHFCHKAKTAEQANRKARQRKLIGFKAIETNRRLKILEAAASG